MTFRRTVVSFFLGMICANTGQAEPIPFNTGWTHHKFPMTREVTFDISSKQLGFSATNAASTLYRPFPNGHVVPNRARFTWHLQSAPPATALDSRFGSDRPLSVSFVFAPTGAVSEIARLGAPRKIVSHRDVRTLSYVWGGSQSSPRILPSPWLPRTAMLIVISHSQTSEGTASLSLAKDLRTHFGDADFQLIAVSISSDTNDTKETAIGSIGQIVLE